MAGWNASRKAMYHYFAINKTLHPSRLEMPDLPKRVFLKNQPKHSFSKPKNSHFTGVLGLQANGYMREQLLNK